MDYGNCRRPHDGDRAVEPRLTVRMGDHARERAFSYDVDLDEVTSSLRTTDWDRVSPDASTPQFPSVTVIGIQPGRHRSGDTKEVVLVMTPSRRRVIAVVARPKPNLCVVITLFDADAPENAQHWVSDRTAPTAAGSRQMPPTRWLRTSAAQLH